jgi:hypothetical protein
MKFVVTVGYGCFVGITRWRKKEKGKPELNEELVWVDTILMVH